MQENDRSPDAKHVKVRVEYKRTTRYSIDSIRSALNKTRQWRKNLGSRQVDYCRRNQAGAHVGDILYLYNILIYIIIDSF